MVLYLIPLFFINNFLLFAAFKGFLMGSLLNRRIYRFMGMLLIGLYAFINCEVLLDILKHYYPIAPFKRLFDSPIYPLIVSISIMGIVYLNGTRWIEGYLIELKKSE